MEILIDGPTLVLSGDFDVRSTWMARSVIYDHLDSVEGDVVLDVSGVSSADVTALKLLAVAHSTKASTCWWWRCQINWAIGPPIE